MATKLLIVYPISDSRQIPAMGRFRHCEKYNAHLWDGREYDTADEEDMKAFNETVLPALSLFEDRIPKCLVRAVYEAPLEVAAATEDEALPLAFEATMPKKRHARMKPGLVTA